MRNGVVVLTLHWHISPFHVFIIIRTKKVILTWCSSRFVHTFVCLFYIEILQTFHPGIHNNRYSRITFHGQRLASEELPFREPSMFYIHTQHCVYHIQLTFWIYKSNKLMYISVCIP